MGCECPKGFDSRRADSACLQYTTSIPEVMQSLNHLVRADKVLYLGISDAPAWVVAKANQYARDHGLAQFSVYQGGSNLLQPRAFLTS